MANTYVWFIWSLLFLLGWGVIFIWLKDKASRKEMFKVSFYTSLLGLTEPIFVPKYWNPPSLFNLAHRTGFDIESLIFSFAIGGLAVILYDRIFKIRHRKISDITKHSPAHRIHLIAIFSSPVTFLLLLILTNINPIYSAILSLLTGFLFTLYCRPDLKSKMIMSSLIFTLLYFVFFLSLVLVYPGYVSQVWNLKAISGILILGIPLEELLFAASFGAIWSSIYEHLGWFRISQNLV